MQYPKSNINPGPLHRHKLIIMAVAITLTLIAYVFFRAMDKLETAELERLENTLKTVLKTTHEALNFWQLEQINSVRHWASHRSLINHVEALAEISHLGDGLSDLTTLESLRMLVNTELKEHEFDGFFVISPDFINLASMRDENIGLRNLLSGHEQRYLQRVFTGETLITQPVYSDVPLLVAGKLQHSQLSMFALSPVTNDHGDIIAAFAS